MQQESQRIRFEDAATWPVSVGTGNCAGTGQSLSVGTLSATLAVDPLLAPGRNGSATLEVYAEDAADGAVSSSQVLDLARDCSPPAAPEDPLRCPVNLSWDGSANGAWPSSTRAFPFTLNATYTRTPAQGRPIVLEATPASVDWTVEVVEQVCTIATDDDPAPVVLEVPQANDAGDAAWATIDIPAGVVQSIEQDDGTLVTHEDEVVASVAALSEMPAAPLVVAASPPVQIGPENSSFTDPIVIGMVPLDGDPTGAALSWYDQEAGRWTACGDDGSGCTPLPACPDGFDSNAVCAETTHFSVWMLTRTDQHLELAVVLEQSTPWSCQAGGRCPDDLELYDVNSVPARPTEAPYSLTVKIATCSDDDCSNPEPLLGVEALPTLSWTPGAGDPGFGTPTTDATSWDGAGSIGYDMPRLASPGWGRLQVAVDATAVCEAMYHIPCPDGANDTPDTVVERREDNCSLDGDPEASADLYECLNLEVYPDMTSATWSYYTKQLTVSSTSTGYLAGENLQQSETVTTLMWTDFCDITRDPYYEDREIAPITVTDPVTVSAYLADPLKPYISVGQRSSDGVYTWTPCISVVVDETVEFVQLAGGEKYTLALCPDGSVLAWGDNTSGQLGNGTFTNSLSPVTVTGLPPVQQIAAGYRHSLALTRDGKVYAWGDNSTGQVGDGTNVDAPDPYLISLPQTAARVAAGEYHSVALLEDGSLMAWGYNSSGQLGDNSTRTRYSPVAVQGGHQFQEVAAGGYHTLGIDVGGGLWAWGANEYGQLGNGTWTDALVPARTALSPLAADIAAGRSHSLALAEDGSVWSWGYNGNGEEGDGSTESHNAPSSVDGLPAIVQVLAGAHHSLALSTEGHTWAWGDNDYGQLGLGDTADRFSAVELTALPQASYLSTGRDFSFAWEMAGAGWAWGRNDTGQLWTGTTASSTIPVSMWPYAEDTSEVTGTGAPAPEMK